MATIKDITSMCKAGNIAEAYETAKADLENAPQDVWAQREMGWALYYLIKNDVEERKQQELYKHLEELANLELLNAENDSLIFDNVVWKLTEYIKPIHRDQLGEINAFFSHIAKFTFPPSKGYSYLLRIGMEFETWPQLADFFEWWNINNLLEEDYQQVTTTNGNKMMSLAERAYIAYSKALLQRNEKEKIESFIPKLESLIDSHPEMTYPGYFCGKLMLALGTERTDALDRVLPFVRKKKTDFWVWQLLSEFYNDDYDKQLACLLRASHSKTKPSFLVKVHTRLAVLYIRSQEYARAKHQIDRAIQGYRMEQWSIPFDIQQWTREPWMQSTTADDSDLIDYMAITDIILYPQMKVSAAVVTYVDEVKKRASIIFGRERRCSIKIQKKIKIGMLINVKYEDEGEGKLNIIGYSIRQDIPESANSYIREVTGVISKQEGRNFANLHVGKLRCFVPPAIVERLHIEDKQEAKALITYDYNKKKDCWNWVCVRCEKSIVRNLP